MNDKRDFEIVKRKGRTPVLALCRKCDVKFITPRELMNVPDEAGSYLANKFDLHRCPFDFSRTPEDDEFLRNALFGTGYSKDGLRNWPKEKSPRSKTA